MTDPLGDPVYSATGQTVWWMAGSSPDVVLLHGFSDDADCWIPVLPELAGLGGVLAVDARGHGASPLPAGPVGPAPQASDTAAVLEALRPARPAVLIGHRRAPPRLRIWPPNVPTWSPL